jgi:small-conductance mechanosensitive channel
MEGWRDLGELRSYLPLVVTLAISAIALIATHTFVGLRARRKGVSLAVSRQLAMLGVTALGIVAVVLTIPVSDALRSQLVGLLGLVLTAVVAFSSTTFVSNAMAGLMLRAVGNFRPGDWVRVGDQFERVTERGLFHVEIQTEDRDLATLPNLYLVTQPVSVVRGSGTIVSTTLSLGYDIDHAFVRKLLVQAADAVSLEDPFVQILELGDFSVKYRVAGFLAEVKQLLSVRSGLRASVLDTLHGAGVEIVSPHFMNQRRVGEGVRFVPPKRSQTTPTPAAPSPEEVIFDKAEEKASLEALRAEQATLRDEIGALEKGVGAAPEGEREGIERRIAERRARLAAIESRLAEAEIKEKSTDQT